jgi:hypothetical protein
MRYNSNCTCTELHKTGADRLNMPDAKGRAELVKLNTSDYETCEFLY